MCPTGRYSSYTFNKHHCSAAAWGIGFKFLQITAALLKIKKLKKINAGQHGDRQSDRVSWKPHAATQGWKWLEYIVGWLFLSKTPILQQFGLSVDARSMKLPRVVALSSCWQSVLWTSSDRKLSGRLKCRFARWLACDLNCARFSSTAGQVLQSLPTSWHWSELNG